MSISVNKLAAPICVQVNGHSWELTQAEANELRLKIGMALDFKSADVMDCINALCCRKFNVSMGALLGRSRPAPLCTARHVAQFLCHYAGFSTTRIGSKFDNRDHSAVVYALSLVEDKIKYEKGMRTTLLFLIDQAEQENGISFRPELKEKLK